MILESFTCVQIDETVWFLRSLTQKKRETGKREDLQFCHKPLHDSSQVTSFWSSVPSENVWVLLQMTSKHHPDLGSAILTKCSSIWVQHTYCLMELAFKNQIWWTYSLNLKVANAAEYLNLILCLSQNLLNSLNLVPFESSLQRMYMALNQHSHRFWHE